MKLTDALPPDGQAFVTEFLRSLSLTDSKLRDCGKKVDVARFMAEYRAENGTIESTRGMPESEKKKRKQRKLDARWYLVAHSGEPLATVAAGLGIGMQTVGKWYRDFGIKRTNWVGRVRQ